MGMSHWQWAFGHIPPCLEARLRNLEGTERCVAVLGTTTLARRLSEVTS